MTDPHARANAEQVRLLQEELSRRAPEPERPPAWLPGLALGLTLAALLGNWLVWRDVGTLLGAALAGALIVGAVGWARWGR